MNRFLITFDDAVSQEDRRRVIEILEQQDIMHSTKFETVYEYQFGAPIPSVAVEYIDIQDFYGDFLASGITSKFPTGCNVRKL